MIRDLKKLNSNNGQIDIILADDHAVTRQGLRMLIEQVKGMSVVAEAKNGREAVQLAERHHPDIVIMEINMPELNGIDATQQIRASMPDVKVIALSRQKDKRMVKEMIKAGASGYLIKSCNFEEVAHAINTVVKNRSYLSESITDIVMKEFANYLSSSEASPSSLLTSREREVTQLIAEGIKTKDIASRLFVSVKTVEAHRRQVMDKLKINNIAQLTKFAVREGLTSLEN